MTDQQPEGTPSFEEQEDLLASALPTAFTEVPVVRRASVGSSTSTGTATVPPGAGDTSAVAAAEPPSSLESSTSSTDSWKDEYDAHVQRWREDSAVARQKAEAERAKWEALRAEEAKGAVSASGSPAAGLNHKDSWLNVGDVASIPGPPNQGSPSPVDVRDVVAGEGAGGHGAEVLETVVPRPQGPAADNGGLSSSQKWETIPSSMASSYPSLSFPSSSPSSHHPSASEKGEKGSKAAGAVGAAPSTTKAPPPPSATLTVLDASLPPRSRAVALITSLTINLFLPFLNGVMLGFGEIFAKNLIQRWGWGTGTSFVGVNAAPKNRRRGVDGQNSTS